MSNKTLSSISKGILDGLDSTETEAINSKEQKSKRVKEGKKKKRSFMLTEKQIKRLYELKYDLVEKDLSTIVGEAIEMYYEAKK